MLTELSVPLLLAFGRTRRIGVLVALAFHTVISVDLDQHFYDFTAALVVLLCLFLPESTLGRPRGQRSPEDQGLRGRRGDLPRARAGPRSLPQVVLTTSDPGVGCRSWRWFAFAGWLIVSVRPRRPRPLPRSRCGRRAPAAWVLVAVVVANGLTPYLELKTAYGWNMYANLVTVGWGVQPLRGARHAGR